MLVDRGRRATQAIAIRVGQRGDMRSIDGQTGRISHQSLYRSQEELKHVLTRVYGPSVHLTGAGDSTFNFKISTFRDALLTLSYCQTSSDLVSSFNADSDDILIITRQRGDFAIHTWCGDYPLAADVGFVFTMNHAIGYSSTRSTANTTFQIARSGFDAALQQYAENMPTRWSGIQDFPLGGAFGHLIQALSRRYRENFESRPGLTYSDASLNLIRNAAMIAIAELVSSGHDGHRREKFVASRRNVMRAVDMINGQAEPLTIHNIAASLGISVRALQDGFRKHLNISPHSLLKTGRIEGARRALMSGEAGSVREAATKWGFSNLTRFTQEYWAAVGEYPADTLRMWSDGRRLGRRP